jgi:hypothetical protein
MTSNNVVALSEYRVRRQARDVIELARLRAAGGPTRPREVDVAAGSSLAAVIAFPEPLPERAPRSRP